MINLKKTHCSGHIWAILISCALIVGMLFLDIFAQNKVELGTKEKARVLEVDNSKIFAVGLLKQGEQMLKVKVLSGKYDGEIFNAANIVRAQADLDKIFEAGDIILVGIPNGANSALDTINAQDYYRLNYALILFSIFAILLVLFGSVTGVKALVSFVFCAVYIWKIVIPLCLNGVNPIAVCLAATAILSGVIIFLVAGFTRKGFTAFAGAFLGVLASFVTALLFAKLFKINGAVMPYSQVLIYSGFERLNLFELYVGAVFLSASGAVMDLGMDIASGMAEVYRHNSSLSRRALFASGIEIGRSVVGTMATTLLLAYSGGYLTLMMAFMAQGVSFLDFINNPYVASETVKTIVGSFGLVLVAPFTALAGAFIIKKKS